MAQTVDIETAYSHAGIGGGIPTELHRRDVSSWQSRTKRTDCPLSMMITKGEPFTDPYIKTEWGLSYPFPETDALGGAIVDGTDATMTVTNGDYFTVGEVVRIDDELIRLTARNSTNVFAIARGQGSTTAAGHVNGSIIMIIAPAVVEGADTPAAPQIHGDLDYGYPQQMEWKNEITHRAKLVKTYETIGLGTDRWKKMLNDLLTEKAPIALENMLLHSKRQAPTLTVPSMSGGITQATYTATRNTALASAPLTERLLMDNLQTVYNLVGQERMGHTILAHPTVLRIISGWYKGIRRMTQDAKSLRIHIAEIDTMFGTFKLVPHYKWLKPSGTTIGAHPGLMVANFRDFNLRPFHSSTKWHTGIRSEPNTDGWKEILYVRGDYVMTAEDPYSRLYLEGFDVDLDNYPGTP